MRWRDLTFSKRVAIGLTLILACAAAVALWVVNASASHTAVLGGGMLALLMATAVGAILARSIALPAARALSVIQAIANGKYDTEIEADRRDEMGQLLAAMRLM